MNQDLSQVAVDDDILSELSPIRKRVSTRKHSRYSDHTTKTIKESISDVEEKKIILSRIDDVARRFRPIDGDKTDFV